MAEELRSCGIQIPMTPQNKLLENYCCRTQGCNHQFSLGMKGVRVGVTPYKDKTGFSSANGIWFVMCPGCDHYFWTHAYDVDNDILEMVGLLNKPVEFVDC